MNRVTKETVERLRSFNCSEDLSRYSAKLLAHEGDTVLVHWDHPEHGTIGMAISEFIPLGEALNMLEEDPVKFGNWDKSWKEI